MNYFDKLEKENLKLEREANWLPALEDEFTLSVESLFEIYPFTWGIKELDESFWAIAYHRLIILAGDSWSWKTTFTMQQAIANANLWNKVAYMSLEMGEKLLIQQTARKRAGISKNTKPWVKPIITQSQQDLYEKQLAYIQSIKNLDIRWYKKITKESFLNEVRDLANKFDLIVIDNLWMIGRWEDELKFVPVITWELMQIRLEKQVTIIALHHLSKWKEHDKRLRTAEAMRWSNKIKDDLDLLAMIEKTDIDTKISLMKDRYEWCSATMNLFFDKWVFKKDII